LQSNNSTSFSRAFGSTKDFVRGSASQFPFAPGGLDTEVIIEDDDVEVDVDTDFFDLEGIVTRAVVVWVNRERENLAYTYYRSICCCSWIGQRITF
jgi:hypothetical protein